MPDLPSPFYRVTSRALIFDDQQRLVIVQDAKGGWQLPGGGLEHDETYYECLKREVREELGADVINASSDSFIYSAPSSRGHRILRIATHVTVSSQDFVPGDDMVAWKAVSRDEFLKTEFISAEGPIHDFVDRIWPTSA